MSWWQAVFGTAAKDPAEGSSVTGRLVAREVTWGTSFARELTKPEDFVLQAPRRPNVSRGKFERESEYQERIQREQSFDAGHIWFLLAHKPIPPGCIGYDVAAEVFKIFFDKHWHWQFNDVGRWSTNKRSYRVQNRFGAQYDVEDYHYHTAILEIANRDALALHACTSSDREAFRPIAGHEMVEPAYCINAYAPRDFARKHEKDLRLVFGVAPSRDGFIEERSSQRETDPETIWDYEHRVRVCLVGLDVVVLGNWGQRTDPVVLASCRALGVS